MRYYKIEATVLSDVEIPRKKSDVFDEFADNMRSLSQTFYIKSDKKDYVFAISTGNNNVIYFGAIINERGNIKSVLDNYMKLCNFKTEYNSIEEQVFDRLRDNLRIAEYSNFIRDDEDLTEKFGITPLLNQHGFNSLKYGENIIELKSREKIVDEAKKHLYSDSFLPVPAPAPSSFHQSATPSSQSVSCSVPASGHTGDTAAWCKVRSWSC